MSILNGIGDLVDKWLGLEQKGQAPYYRHKTATNNLSRRQVPIAGTRELLEASYNRIHSNWLAAEYSNPSRENWRWKRHLELSPKNTSKEVTLERAIVKSCGENWSNQMPVESGLISPNKGRTAIDLVHRESMSKYSLIELKVASNTPLFAAIEIMMYGLLFVWSKDNLQRLDYVTKAQPVLSATAVTLEVLAPVEYYSGFDLRILEKALDEGFGSFGERHGLALRFGFTELGVGYDSNYSSENLRSAISNRYPVWID
jgi:hypothetical protein